MQITKNYQLGIISFICCVLSSLLAAYAFDTFSGALCGALTCPAIAAAFVFFIFGMIKTFHEHDFIDRQNLDKPIKIKITSGLLGIIAIVLIGFI